MVGVYVYDGGLSVCVRGGLDGGDGDGDLIWRFA